MYKRIILILTFLTSVALTSAQPRKVTVKEFLKLSPSDTSSYLVQGVVTKVRSSVSGSFYLQDGTGTMLVYGIADPENPRLNFTQLDIVQGDTVSVSGRFTLYNGTTKEMKDGRLVAKSDGPDHNLPFYERLDRKPAFKGKAGDEGLEAFRIWVQGHVHAPASGSKGTVLVRFVVGRDGGVQEVRVLRGASPELNDEAVRVVKSAPKWKPAKMDGSPIRVPFTVRVVFD